MKVKDVILDSTQFEVKTDVSKQSALNTKIANMVDGGVTAHLNNKLDYVGQNIYSIFDAHFSQIEAQLGINSIGNEKHASTSNTDKAMCSSACEGIPAALTNATVINSANQLPSRTNEPMPHHTTLYSSAPNASMLYGPASSLRHISTPPNLSQAYNAPIANRPRPEDVGSGANFWYRA
jgi:hypothetical protein